MVKPFLLIICIILLQRIHLQSELISNEFFLSLLFRYHVKLIYEEPFKIGAYFVPFALVITVMFVGLLAFLVKTSIEFLLVSFVFNLVNQMLFTTTSNSSSSSSTFSIETIKNEKIR